MTNIYFPYLTLNFGIVPLYRESPIYPLQSSHSSKREIHCFNTEQLEKNSFLFLFFFIQVIYTALINFSAQYALVYQFDAVPVGTIPLQQFD